MGPCEQELAPDASPTHRREEVTRYVGASASNRVEKHEWSRRSAAMVRTLFAGERPVDRPCWRRPRRSFRGRSIGQRLGSLQRRNRVPRWQRGRAGLAHRDRSRPSRPVRRALPDEGAAGPRFGMADLPPRRRAPVLASRRGDPCVGCAAARQASALGPAARADLSSQSRLCDSARTMQVEPHPCPPSSIFRPLSRTAAAWRRKHEGWISGGVSGSIVTYTGVFHGYRSADCPHSRDARFGA